MLPVITAPVAVPFASVTLTSTAPLAPRVTFTSLLVMPLPNASVLLPPWRKASLPVMLSTPSPRRICTVAPRFARPSLTLSLPRPPETMVLLLNTASSSAIAPPVNCWPSAMVVVVTLV